MLDEDYDELLGNLILNLPSGEDDGYSLDENIPKDTKVDYFCNNLRSWCEAVILDDVGGVLSINYLVPSFVRQVEPGRQQEVKNVKINKMMVRKAGSRINNIETNINSYYEFMRAHLLKYK